MEASQSCFGCAGMQRGKFCILNKEYSAEDYAKLVKKIVAHMRTTGEWGEMFPMALSPHGYNRSTAQMYYPLTRQQATEKGLTWDDAELPAPTAKNVVPADRLPDDIRDIPDDILDWAVQCEVTKRPFRLTKRELAFYRTQRLPLPRRSPDQRHMDRFSKRNPRVLWDRECAKCKNAIQTTYAPERPEIVYCEACYLQAVY